MRKLHSSLTYICYGGRVFKYSERQENNFNADNLDELKK